MEETGTLTGGAARITAGGAVRINAYNGPLPDGERGVEFYTLAKPSSSIPNGGLTTWHPGADPCVTQDGDYAKMPIVVTKNTRA